MSSRLLSRTTLALLFAVPSLLSAQVVPPPVAEQLAGAVQALPKEMREGAGVMGYRTAGKLELLRPAKNGMLCLADDPADDQFHVACYARTMDPFMARGRELRTQGVMGARVDTVRYAEVKAGKIKMPTAPASLYQIFAPKNAYDAKANTVTGGRKLFVVYIPFATPETTGLSTTPSDKEPWLMLPGTPKAHIMFSASM